jgi:hypothetical protein
MRINLPSDAAALGAYVPRLFAITGEDQWVKRWRDLGHDFNRSPMLARIGADYHWLELLLHDLAATIASRGELGPCVYQKPKLGRSGDEVRLGWQVT